MNEERKVKKEIISSVGILLVCLALFFGIIPAAVEGGPPALLPKISVLWIAAFSLMLLISNFKRREAGFRKPEEAALIDKVDLEGGEASKVLLLILVWGIHIFSLPFFGFYLGGFCVLMLSIRFLRKHSLKSLIAWSTGALAGLFFLFEKILQLRLPKGRLVDFLADYFL